MTASLERTTGVVPSVPLAGGTSSGKQTFAAGVQITDDDGTTAIDGYRSLAFLTPPAADDPVLGLGFKYPDAFAAGLNYAESDAFVILSDADNGATLPANILKVISATTNATPVAVTTSTAHGFITGDIVRITGTGIAALDGKFWKITVTDTTHFTLNGSTAPGSTAAVGYAFSDRGAPLSRIADTGPGFTGAMHLAAGLRGRSGGSLPGYGFWIQPAADLIPLLIHNVDTNKWTPAPVSDYITVIDVRASNAVRFAVNAAGQTVADPGSAGAPGIVFAGDTDTGLFTSAANTIQFAAGGSQRMAVSSTVVSVADGQNITGGTSTGTMIGTTTTQKWGFYGATPITRRSGAAQAAVAVTGSTNATPFGYTTAAQADAIVTLVNELRAWAVVQGFIKGSA